MSDSGPSPVWPWLLAAAGILAGIALVGVNLALGFGFEEMLTNYSLINVITAFTFSPLAALILVKQPRHRVGWMMMLVGIFGAAQVLGGGIAELIGGSTAITALPGWVKFLGWLAYWVWIPVTLPTILILPLYFPNDRLPSRRWRWLAIVNLSFVIVMTLAWVVAYSVWAVDDPTLTFESGFPTQVEWAGAVAEAGFSVIPLLALAVVASVVVRFRRSEGTERRQLVWLLYGFATSIPLLTIGLIATSALDDVTASGALWPFVVISVAVIPIPVAIGIAIVRYQLFDINLVVSKSFLVAGLGVFIVAVYVAVVVGIGALLGSGDEPDLVLQVVATALVAVLFQPVKRRLDRWATRLVFGHRATPYEVLSSFSAFAAMTPDESSLSDIACLLAEGTGGDPAVVWLRVGDSLTPVASSSLVFGGLAPVPVVPGWAHQLPGDIVVPVEHDGELLAAFSVTKARGEQATSQDEDLTRRLASSVALLLRNVRLTAELRARRDELEDSRRRVVSAQDETRRRLERDLHDGAQQQLVALKVKLGLARSLAERASADQTAGLLAGLAGEADEAVETLRSLARGIYPPLLEAEGLGAAIQSQVRRNVLPVTVHAVGVGRHHRETEAAVYFCVLEALNNTTKYANATSVHVRLAQSGDSLVFSVEDDGDGFDPQQGSSGTGIDGMNDRLDTIDGTLSVESRPGGGTTVRGTVPLERSDVESALV